MSFLLKWLLGKGDGNLRLRPHRRVELDVPYDAAYDRVLGAVDRTLGAHVAVDDRRTGFIEAAFGLVNNERIRCRIERLDESHTAIGIEAYFRAGATIHTTSQAVDALADALRPE